jgi:hypothetical protein
MKGGENTVVLSESSLKTALKTLIAGISVTAFFATTGFIAAFGREQFLGINLSDWSVQTLTIFAGRFAADSFFLVLNLAARHWFILGLGLVLTGVAIFLIRHMKTPAYCAPAAESLLALPILVWLLFSIGNFEAATIPLRGWILSPNDETPLSNAVRQLHPKVSVAPQSSSQYVQTAISTSAVSPGVTKLEDYYFSSQLESPGVLLLEASSDDVGKQLNAIGFNANTRKEARNSLYSRYSSAVAACILALIYVLLSKQGPELKYWGDLLFVLRTSVIAALLIAALLLPYTYGKVIDSTLFPDSYITYLQPSTDSIDGKAELVSGEYPIVSKTDTSIFLLWIQGGGGHTEVIEVPIQKIVQLDLQADVDVLAKISTCIANPGKECQ